MAFDTLQEFVVFLEQNGELIRIKEPVSTNLEMTELGRRMIEKDGPAILIENPVIDHGKWGNSSKTKSMPVLINLFGTVYRVAMGLGRKPGELKELGELLAIF